MRPTVFRRYFLPAIFFSCFTPGLYAQLSAKDSVYFLQPINNAIKEHQQMIGVDSRLFNGIQYAGYPFSFVKGHQFFDTTAAMPGTITYDDVYYNDVQLLYDEVSDKAIVISNQRRVELSSERINDFTILNHHFVRIVKDSSGKTPISKDGFYELLYTGKVQVFKKEAKEVFEELSSEQGILRRILVKVNYYIGKDNSYFPVTNKKDVMAIYKDRKKEVRDYISNNGLSFRNNKEEAITKVSAYYDQLIK